MKILEALYLLRLFDKNRGKNVHANTPTSLVVYVFTAHTRDDKR